MLIATELSAKLHALFSDTRVVSNSIFVLPTGTIMLHENRCRVRF